MNLHKFTFYFLLLLIYREIAIPKELHKKLKSDFYEEVILPTIEVEEKENLKLMREIGPLIELIQNTQSQAKTELITAIKTNNLNSLNNETTLDENLDSKNSTNNSNSLHNLENSDNDQNKMEVMIMNANKVMQNLNEVTSPILFFIIKKIRPFIDSRIGVMLSKAGFNSYLRKTTSIYDKLIIKTIFREANDNKKLVCGQSAKINFTISNQDSSIIYNNYETTPISIIIGLNSLNRGMELGMIGMTPGEERIITVTKPLNFGNHELNLSLKDLETVDFKVKLLDIASDIKLNNFDYNFRYYDIVSNISQKISCGSLVQIDLKILNASGDILYQTPENQKIFFTIGSRLMPPILEYGLIGATNNGKRLIFTKSEALLSMKNIACIDNIEDLIKNNNGVILEINPKILR